MGRRHATLSGLLWNQEEVEADVVVLVFDEAVVNDTSRRRVGDSRPVLHEHPLVDALVDDDQSDGWRPRCVVESREHLSQLSNLFLDDLVSHALADSISVDQDFGRELVAVIFGKRTDRLFHALVEVSLDQLLELLLEQEAGEVLGLLSVDGGREPND